MLLIKKNNNNPLHFIYLSDTLHFCVYVQARPILMRASEGGSYEELVDPRLERNYDPAEMLRTVASAAACIRHSARRRPKMSQVRSKYYSFNSSVYIYIYI